MASGLRLVGAIALARRRHRRKLHVLMYHGVVPRLEGPAAFGDLFLSAGVFARQMQDLKRWARVLSLEQIIEAIDAGGAFPDRAVAITFDDGYRNTMTVALPILQALALPATVFVPAGQVGRETLLWPDALRGLVFEAAAGRQRVDLGAGFAIDGGLGGDAEGVFADLTSRILDLPRDRHVAVVERIGLLDREERLAERYPQFGLAGWEEWRRAAAGGLMTVGSHGLDHERLLGMAAERQLIELQQSKRLIERELSRPCQAFAYPYGQWDQAVALRAAQAGFECAFTTDEGLNGLQQDRFALRRTMIGDKGSFSLFQARVSGIWGAVGAMLGADAQERPWR